MVIGRIGVEKLELLGIFGSAVFRDPKSGDAEEVIADHVGQRDATNGRVKKIGPLGKYRGHQQATVGPPRNGQPLA